MTAAISEVTTNLMLHTLLALPQGVQAMSVDFPGLTQTSLNMGVLKLEDDGLHITFSIRSSIASQKEMLAQRVHAIVEFAGGTVTVTLSPVGNRLTDISFTLAGACLARTCFELSSASTVIIQSGDRRLALDRDSLIFQDTAASLETTVP